jgi:hypothetical protein
MGTSLRCGRVGGGIALKNGYRSLEWLGRGGARDTKDMRGRILGMAKMVLKTNISSSNGAPLGIQSSVRAVYNQKARGMDSMALLLWIPTQRSLEGITDNQERMGR